MRGEQYLNKRQQFTTVSSKGRSWASKLVVLKALPNGLTSSRYGFSVSKQVGNAVMRNRIKRILREILRKASLKSGWDIIFIARPPVAIVGYTELKGTIEAILSRAGLLEAEKGNGLTGVESLAE